jgi:hypothetical protein
MNLDCDHVDGGVTTISGIGDAIAADHEASAIWIGLFRTIVDAHAPVCDVFASVDQDVVSSNEDNHVGAHANARGYGGKMTIFSNGSYDQCKYPDPLIYIPI